MRIDRKELPDWVKGLTTIVMHGSLPCATVYFRNGFIEVETCDPYQNATLDLTQAKFTIERVEDIVLPNGIIVASQLRKYDMSQLSADPVRPTTDNVKRALKVLKLEVDDDDDEYIKEIYHEELLSYLVVSKNLIHVYKEMIEENAIDEPLFPILIDVLERQDAPNRLGTKLDDLFINVKSGKMVRRRELPAYLWNSRLVAACVEGNYILHPDVLVKPRRDVSMEMIYDAESTALGGTMPITFADWMALARKNAPLLSWIEVYYPKDASKASPWQEAAEHSLQKWRGLDKEVLNKYGLIFDGQSGRISERYNCGMSMAILGSHTCALCVHHLQAQKTIASERCGLCPLFLATGVSCDYAESPYREARHGNVTPIVSALERTVEYCKEKPHYTPRPDDNSTTS